jgi:carotenoid cleavage dioxygenase
MSVTFPEIPLYKGWGTPLRVESDIKGLELIQGKLPAELNGALFRCGPDRQYPSMYKDDIFIDGEGMVHGFYFKDGFVDYKSRWVRNERFLLQEKARRSLFGRYRNRYTNDPSVAGKNMGTANTSAVYHGKRLLILKEDSLPQEVHQDTLETIGEYNFNGAVKAVSLTAHPKIDMHRNELLTYSYQARGDCTTDFAFYIADANGKIVHEMWFNMPYPGMVHDFAATDTHIIVPFFPLITDMEVLKKGGPYYQWYGDKPSHYAVFPRRGKTEDIRWFRGPTVSAGHMMNAYNEGSKLHLDICLYLGSCFDFFPAHDGSAFKPCPPQLTRLTFDLEGKSDTHETKLLMPTPCEMPKIDERYMGKPYRYGYVICRSPTAIAGEIGMGAIGRFDHQTGKLDTWSPGQGFGVQEPTFVPRKPGAPEGDGFVLSLVNRLSEMRSDLVVLDAQRIADGPIATLRLPTRVRVTFHGQWVAEETLKTGRFPV